MKIADRFRGKMASNEKIQANINQIVHFDQRFQAAMQLGNVEQMHELATWAEANGLGLAKRAKRAAVEMSQKRGGYG